MAAGNSAELTPDEVREALDRLAALWNEAWANGAMAPPDLRFGTSMSRVWMSQKTGEIQWSKVQPLDWMATVDAPGLPAAASPGPITMAPTTRKCALCGDTVPIDKPACQRAMDCVDLGNIIARKKLLKEM